MTNVINIYKLLDTFLDYRFEPLSIPLKGKLQKVLKCLTFSCKSESPAMQYSVRCTGMLQKCLQSRIRTISTYNMDVKRANHGTTKIITIPTHIVTLCGTTSSANTALLQWPWVILQAQQTDWLSLHRLRSTIRQKEIWIRKQQAKCFGVLWLYNTNRHWELC